MKKKKGRFSRFIRPILSLYDLVIVNLVILYHLNFEIKGLYFSLLASLAWMVISAFTNFYKIYRFTPEIKIFTLIFKQYFVFTLVLFFFFGFFRSTDFLVSSAIIYFISNAISNVLNSSLPFGDFMLKSSTLVNFLLRSLIISEERPGSFARTVI